MIELRKDPGLPPHMVRSGDDSFRKRRELLLTHWGGDLWMMMFEATSNPGIAIGQGGLSGDEALYEFHKTKSIADIAICLHSTAWGKGYGTQIVLAIREFGWNVGNLDFVTLTTRIDNHAMRRVMDKLGCGEGLPLIDMGQECLRWVFENPRLEKEVTKPEPSTPRPLRPAPSYAFSTASGRINLRSMTVEDLDHIIALRADPRMSPDGSPPERFRAAMEVNLTRWDGTDWFFVFIEEAIPEKPIVGFGGLARTEELVKQHNTESMADTGLALCPSVWRKGYGSEIVLALREFGWNTLGLDLVTLTTEVKNAAVRGMMRKMGSGEGDPITEDGRAHIIWMFPNPKLEEAKDVPEVESVATAITSTLSLGD